MVKRICLISVGWVSISLGFIGVITPILLTTPFLLLSAWAFSKSSPKFYRWLTENKILGTYIKEWREHKRIPKRAKYIISGMLLVSIAYSLTVLGFFEST